MPALRRRRAPGDRSPRGGRSPGPATSRSGARLCAAPAALVSVALLATAAPALAAPWKSAASISATVSMATLSSSFGFLSGSGTVSTDGSTYAMNGLVNATGYTTLTNTSSIPARLSLRVQLGGLVAGTTVYACSQAWNTSTATCAGTSTLIADSGLAGSLTASWTATTASAAGSKLYLKASIGGVVNSLTLTTQPVVPRSAGDRT